jgi:hypothetical protein
MNSTQKNKSRMISLWLDLDYIYKNKHYELSLCTLCAQNIHQNIKQTKNS